MGRHKTISDEEVLRIARDVFRAHGHTATTRQIADTAGISEAILYQRFGRKDALFFAAMHAVGPDIDELLGPKEPPDDALKYLRGAVVHLGQYFAEVIPVALREMMHPSFDPAQFAHGEATGPGALQAGLAERLTSLARRRRLATRSANATARLLVSLAHDWALRGALAGHASALRVGELKDMVDLVWEGLRPRGA